MTAREFLEQVVRPNVSEFHNEYASIRHAFNAVASIDALAAHIFDERRASTLVSHKNDLAYRDYLAGRNSAFRSLRDIAKANKHVRLIRGNPVVQTASQVTSRAIDYGQGRFGAGRYGGPPQVVVDIGPSDFRYVETLVDESLVFLETEMGTLNP